MEALDAGRSHPPFRRRCRAVETAGPHRRPNLRVTLINHSTVLLQQNGLSHSHRSDLVRARQSAVPPSVRAAAGCRACAGRIFPASTSCSSATITTIIWIFARLRRLADRGQSQFVVPLGVARLLAREQASAPSTSSIGANRCRWLERRFTACPRCISRREALRPQSDPVVRICRSKRPDRIVYFAGDTGFGDHFDRIRERFGAAAPGAAADRRVRAALVHVAGAYGVRTRPFGRMRSWAPRPASRSTTARSSSAMRAIDTPKKRLSEYYAGRFVSGAGQWPIRDAS